ncbi:MAG: hypothetical protein QME74_07865 [Candidatus Edwardsbacteria bacterium]|nr:hypothetical protein [Candidatus Edwardsbacteria bacterium]
MKTFSTTISAIEARLREVRARWRTAESGKRTAQAIVLATAWIFFLHVFDALFPLSIPVRTGLLPVNFAVALAALGYAVFPLFIPFPLNRAARLVETIHPEIKQELSTAWEWARRSDARDREQYSEELIHALQQRALERLRAVDTAKLFPANRTLRLACSCVPAILLMAALISPSQFRLTIQRFGNPKGACGNWEQAAVNPGSVRIAAGRSVRITARLDQFSVIWNNTDGKSGSILSEEGAVELSAIRKGTKYRIVRRREQSPGYIITVYQPLEISGLRVRITPPAYARLKQNEQENQGDISGLKGSDVAITASATQKLQQAGIAMDGGALFAGTILHDSLVRVGFDLRQPAVPARHSAFRHAGVAGAYRLWARAVSGDTLINPQRYTITVQEDAFPIVELTAPESDLALERSLAVNIQGRASDDFGLSAIALAYEAHGERTDVMTMRIAPTSPRYIPDKSGQAGASWGELGQVADTAFGYRWDLGGLSLLPGDSVVYWLEARDNDAVSGPKTACSAKRILRLPTMEDIFKQQELADSASRQSLERAEPVISDLKRELERLSQAIKETRSLDWQQKAALEDALKQEQQLMENLQQAADQALAAMRTDQTRFSFDAETVQKMEELRQLFDQAATEEMRQFMEKMRQAVEKADRDAVEKALENLKLSQEEFKKRLDAAIASLKQLQQEQKLDLLHKQADQLLQEQKDLKERTAQSKTDAQQLARRQESLAKDTEILAQKLKERADELEKNDPDVARPLRNASNLLQNNQTAATMRKAGQHLRQQEPQPAEADQQQAISDLSQVTAGVRQAKSGMRSRRSQAAAQALRQKASEIVRLSQQQESLNQRLGKMREGRNDLADEQQSLERAAARMTQDLERMGRKGLPLPPQAGAALSQAMQHMKAAGRNAAEGRGQQAGDDGKIAQSALNQAALALMQSASRMGSSSGSGDMMEDMEGLSSQQQALNQQTGQMADQQQELQLQAMQSQIPRLAAEQAAIRQGLQQFNEQYAGRADRAGRTYDLVREMEKVIDDLKAGRVTKETRQRQEKILTRMLDAQRSLQEQDFSRQRQAEPASDASGLRRIKTAPPAGQSWKQYQLWRDWRSEPYPIEYRQMLENYFRSLGQ